MTRKLFVLLPPSEGKEAGGAKKASSSTFAKTLGAGREEVRQALETALRTGTPAKLEKLLKVKGPLLERAIEASHEYVAGDAPVLRAYERYSGVVWKHLDPQTLSSHQLDRVLIPSGLYGLTTARDYVADYRLKMDVRLGDLGLLGSFWREAVTKALATHAKRATIVNLLPQEHEQAIDLDVLSQSANVQTVPFLTYKGEGAAGHDAKAAKGMMARLVLTEGLGALEGFSWQGWKAVSHEGQLQIRAPKKK